MAVRDVVQAAAGVGGDKLYVEDVFSTYLYTGNGSTQTITNGIDLDGEGGLVWFKQRNAANNHALFDTSRGTNKLLYSNTISAQVDSVVSYSDNTLTAFNANGFTLGNDPNLQVVNTSPNTYASWTFRKAPKFFDVVTYTGTNVAGQTFSHNLGSVPGCVIIKNTNETGYGWYVYHKGLNGGTNPEQYWVGLNVTNAQSANSSIWNNTAPTSTEFTVGAANGVNLSGNSFVAYLFAHDAGGFGDDGEQNVISCGSYSHTNGSNTTVTLGFEPQFVINRFTGIGIWVLMDSLRGMPVSGVNGRVLQPQSSDAEEAGDIISPTATGFIVGSSLETGTYIYIAIRRPMKTPESGTEVFAVAKSINPGEPAFVSGFPVDMSIHKDTTGGEPRNGARLIENKKLVTSSTSAEGSGNDEIVYDFMNGFYEPLDYGSPPGAIGSTNFVGYMFRRAPGFMDVVAYTGTGSATTFSHNLTVVPELMIVKSRSAERAWRVYSSTVGNTGSLRLNADAASDTGVTAYWNNTTPTSSVFTVGTDNDTNGSGNTYVAYLFASCPGVSKVGSYTGTGADLNVDCGFSAGARFILIKRTDSTGDWYVWDSARGIVAGNDPYLLLNSTAAEVTSTDYIDPLASGFTVTSTAPAALNASGGSYIFLAIA